MWENGMLVVVVMFADILNWFFCVYDNRNDWIQ